MALALGFREAALQQPGACYPGQQSPRKDPVTKKAYSGRQCRLGLPAGLSNTSTSLQALPTSSPPREAERVPQENTNGSAGESQESPALQERLDSGKFASTSAALGDSDQLETSVAQQLIESRNPALTLQQIETAFKFPLDAFQRESVQHYLQGHSVLVCAPTGAGKTAIAEAATIAALARGQRVIYTTPLKALSNQKLFEMRRQFGHDSVGLQTGDVSLNAEGDIVVMTTEILRNILFREAADTADSEQGAADEAALQTRMTDVGLVVLDEVHYLGDEHRGSVWEEIIISCPSRIPLLCMSATVRNPDDLGGWISKVHGRCETVVTTFRPIPLHWNFSYSGNAETHMVPFFGKEQKLNSVLIESNYQLSDSSDAEDQNFGKRRGRKVIYRSEGSRKVEALQAKAPCIEEVLQVLQQRDLLPCIWFLLSRIGCDNAVLRLETQQMSVLSKPERQQVIEALKQLRTEQPEAIRENMCGALLNGIASHHAGCLPAWKALVEALYQKGLVKVVFATGTLAAGINMPARSTVINSVSRRVPGGSVTLKHNELMQMAGRAGRRGFDTEGHCLLLQDRFGTPEDIFELIAKGPEPLQSHFATGYGMVLKVLHTHTLKSARRFVERSFYNYLADEGAARKQTIAKDKAETAAKLIEEADRLQQASGEGHDIFPQYLQAKDRYQESRRDYRKVLRKLLLQRGSNAASAMKGQALPITVWLEMEKFDTDAQEENCIPAVIICNEKSNFRFKENCKYLCLTADNRLMQIQAKHIAFFGKLAKPLLAAQSLTAVQLAKKTEDWSVLKETGALIAPGSGRTATTAARLAGAKAKAVPMDSQLKALVVAADVEMKELRAKAQTLQTKANKERESRPYLQLRAEATKLRKESNEILNELRDKQKDKNTSWRSFESTLSVLIAAGALEEGSLKATGLGEIAREINSENELRTALVMTHPATQTLTASQLAAVMSSIVASEFNHRPNMYVSYGCSNETLEVIESMESSREWLYGLQFEAGITAGLGVDVRLAGLVEAWAGGASWSQLTADSNVDGGDVARLLNRTVDLLRQIQHCQTVGTTMRTAAREAVKSMSRIPITDVVA